MPKNSPSVPLPVVDEIITLSLAEASRLSGLTVRELRRSAAIIDHGRRNKRISLASYRALLESRTIHPSSPTP